MENILKKYEKIKIYNRFIKSSLKGKRYIWYWWSRIRYFEADGHLSVLKKPLHQNLTRKDLGIFTPTQSAFPVELIMDCQIIDKNFTQNHQTKSWLFTELKQRGLALPDVSYCVRGTNGQLYFDLYKDKITSPVDTES